MASKYVSDRTPVQPKQGPEVVPPTFDTTKPGDRGKVPSFGDQVDATRSVLRGSGLNAAALNAINAGNAGIDKQRRNR
jgi:hypothetical protein